MTPLHHPILRFPSADSILAFGGGEAVSVDRFCGDVAALAAQLPSADYLVNLCADRYRFAVSFFASFCRCQVTLLPSIEASGPLKELVRQYPGLYFLTDTSVRLAGLPIFRYPRSLQGILDTEVPDMPANRLAAILFTSGSTGTPTPNPRSWGALVASTRAAAKALGLDGIRGAALVGTVPHQHSFGLESIVMLSLQHGIAFHRTRSLLPADVIAQLEETPPPRVLVTTPIHLRSLVAHHGALPELSRIISATAPLSPTLAAAAEERFGTSLFEVYGCSETGQIATRRTVDTALWSCIDGIDLVPCGEDVWASGPAAAREAPLNDVIELRGPGQFVLHGRKSDLINIGGKRGSLAHLNHHLNAVPGVRDGMFVVPQAAGESLRLIAYVVAPGLTTEAIVAALRLHIDPAFLPRPIHFVDALPRNLLGKVSRAATERLVLETTSR